MSRDVIKQLKALRHADINPSEEWLENNRALLMSQIRNTICPEKKSLITSFIHRAEEVFLHSSSRLVRIGAAVVLVAVVVVTGQVATSQAAGAIPGDTLYGLKRTTENTKLALASVVADQNQLVKLHLDLAAVRADEVKQVITRKPERKAAAQAAVKDLQQELQTANQKLDTLKQQAPNNVKDTILNVQQTTSAIKGTLQDVKDNLQISTSSVDKNLSQDLATAKQLVNTTNVASVQVAVANHLQGGDVSKDDVTKLVDNTLQSVVADTTQSKQVLAEVNNAVNQLSTSTVTSTIATTTIKLASTETAQATEQTKVAGQQIDQKVSEVKELVAHGNDLTHVVDKVREVSDASTAVEKISDKTIQNIQTLLPQVQVLKNNDPSTSTTSTTNTAVSTTPLGSINPTTTISTSTTTTSTTKNTSSTPTSTFSTTTSRTTTARTTTSVTIPPPCSTFACRDQ
jgi:hypothetical protein